MRFALLAALAAAPAAQAFDYMDVCGGQPTRWSNNRTTYQVSTNYTSNELSWPTYTNQLELSFEEWSEPGCTAYTPTRGSDVSGDPGGSSSSNMVGFYESSWPASWGSSTIGITLVSYNPSNCLIADSDMVFNGRNFSFSSTGSNSSQVDFRSVATHEAGHWAGLDHSSYSGSSLWPSYSGGTAERDLSCDDSEAVCGSMPSGGNSCSDDNYCPCGVGCNNGTCAGTTTNPDPGECSGAGATYSESEPNDWDGEDDVDFFQPTGGGDVVINGSITCGNNGEQYTADGDWFVVDLPCTDDARFSLDWSGNSDLDFIVYDTSSNDPFAYNTEAGTSGPTTDDAVAGGRIFAFVGCWEGSSTSYTLRIDRPPYSTSTNPDPDPDTSVPDDCGDVDNLGECRGDVAYWCQDGELLFRDCAGEGGCGLTEEYGYYCLDLGTPSNDTDFNDTGDPLPLFPGCNCSTSPTPLSLLGGLPLFLLLPVLRRRR